MPRILTTKDALMNYAAWYAMRYFPSLRKLRESLQKKSFNNTALVDEVMKEMGEYISEERTVDGLVRSYIEQSKTRPYIEQKLKLKKFGEEIIISTLESYRDSFTSWTSYESTITRKMNDYLGKNKSKRYIIGTLIQKYPNFKNEITELLNGASPDETESIQRELAKLSGKYDVTDKKDRQKIMQKLCTKWFPYDAVKKVMKDEY